MAIAAQTQELPGWLPSLPVGSFPWIVFGLILFLIALWPFFAIRAGMRGRGAREFGLQK